MHSENDYLSGYNRVWGQGKNNERCKNDKGTFTVLFSFDRFWGENILENKHLSIFLFEKWVKMGTFIK